jgi:hypothetical protein
MNVGLQLIVELSTVANLARRCKSAGGEIGNLSDQQVTFRRGTAYPSLRRRTLRHAEQVLYARGIVQNVPTVETESKARIIVNRR